MSDCKKCESEATCLDAPKGCTDYRETDEARRNRIEAEVKAHDERIRADEHNKTVDEFARRLNLKFVELPLDDLIVLDILKDINRVAKQMKGEEE